MFINVVCRCFQGNRSISALSILASELHDKGLRVVGKMLQVRKMMCCIRFIQFGYAHAVCVLYRHLNMCGTLVCVWTNFQRKHCTISFVVLW